MRLHRLSVAAFGPFAGVETVDFDALSQGGLFLLHGATGAGKTSVLDAVSFALYGEVPGGRPRHRLRSDHARPETATEVRLELTLDGRRLELTRRPEYERPKKRGAGTTLERAQSLLREWREDGPQGPGWRGVSTSHQEIGAEVQSLLGMSREQFCQVVLLPQGDFARFLHAGAQERAELLGRLFGTGRFRDAESWLDERRRAAEKAYAGLRGGLGHIVQRLIEAAGAETAAEAPAPAPVDDGHGGRPGASAVAAPLGWAAQLRAAAWERLAVAESAQRLATERYETARAAAAQAAALAELQRRHRQALGRLAELDARAETHRADAERLALAERAQPVGPLLRLRAAAYDGFRRAAEAERAARAAVARDPLVAPLAEAPAPVLGRAEAEIREESGRLRSLGEAEQRLAQLRREQRRLAAEQEQADSRREEAERWLAGWPAEQQRYEAVAERAREAGLRAEQLSERLEAARRRLEAAGERDALAVAVAAVEQEETALRGAALDARERLLSLREQRIAGMAAELAERLGAGEPCPVCGSAEHPAPAAPRPGRVTRADEERAEADQRRAETAAEAAAYRVRAVREQAAAAAAAAGPDPAEQLAAAVERLRTEHGAALAAAAAAVPAAEELDRLAGEQRARSAELRAWGERAAGHAAALETLAAEEQALASRLAAALPTLGVPRFAEGWAGAGPRADGRPGEGGAESAAAPSVPRAGAAADGGGPGVSALPAATLHGQGTSAATVAPAAPSGSGEPVGVAGAPLPGQRAADALPLAARISALADAAESLDRAAGTARAAEAARDELDRLDEQLAAQAVGAGFPDAAAAERALPTERELAGLRERVERYRAERALVAGQLAEPEPAAAAALPTADPEAAEAARAAAEQQLRQAFAAVREAERRCADLVRLSGELARSARRSAPLAEESAVTEGLYGLVRGTSPENRLRMSLETYVLAARLEQVAAAASVRLLRMSGGRYTLRHSDERARGGARSGLGLRVLDSWTGMERDTATLSGGESFFASLALALGLADVVTDEAGGRPLDTLFIDEGFGSLDEDTLDDVMDVLDQLRERDRAVGIVSHVADLRRRVPTQLHVRKDRDGSTLRIRGAHG